MAIRYSGQMQDRTGAEQEVNNKDQRNLAEENLKRYAELALRVFNRIQADPDAYADFQTLIAERNRRKMSSQRSTSKPKKPK